MTKRFFLGKLALAEALSRGIWLPHNPKWEIGKTYLYYMKLGEESVHTLGSIKILKTIRLFDEEYTLVRLVSLPELSPNIRAKNAKNILRIRRNIKAGLVDAISL